jgi:hypothetical protein
MVDAVTAYSARWYDWIKEEAIPFIFRANWCMDDLEAFKLAGFRSIFGSETVDLKRRKALFNDK